MICRIASALFFICMIPFFSISLAIFGITFEFQYSPEFSFLVFELFKYAAGFAAVALIALPFEEL